MRNELANLRGASAGHMPTATHEISLPGDLQSGSPCTEHGRLESAKPMQHMNWYMRSIASQGAMRDFAGWSFTAFQKNWGRPPHDAALHRPFVPCSHPAGVNLPKENCSQLFFSEP